jgi:hypothetical protein
MRQMLIALAAAFAVWAGFPTLASGNVIYQYHSTCDSIIAPGPISPAQTFLCADLPSDKILVTVIVRDSYVPGTSLTPDDVVSVEYRDPFPYIAEFDVFGPGDIAGVLPASSGGPGFLMVRQGMADVALDIETDKWVYTCCGEGELHLASGPPGAWTVTEPGTLALVALALYGFPRRLRNSGRRSRDWQSRTHWS